MNIVRGHRSNKHSSGFSLLEIVFVLGLIAVLVTWITVSVSTVETEDKLRAASGEIIAMAAQARNIAVRQQRVYEVVLTEEKVSLAPKYPKFEEYEQEEGEQPLAHKDITSSRDNDDEVTYEILRWRSDDWIELEKDKEVTVSLDPSGLVEPISIRCTIDKSWIMQELHPLTAHVRYEETNIEKE